MNIIRWLLVIPVCIISFVIMRWVCLFFLMAGLGNAGIISAVGTCIIEGGLAVGMGLLAAMKMAPSHQVTVVYVLSFMISLVAIFSMAVSATGNYGFGDIPKLQEYATIFLTIITCVYISYTVKKMGI